MNRLTKCGKYQLINGINHYQGSKRLFFHTELVSGSSINSLPLEGGGLG
jgi:hypothetical protein